MDKKLSKSYKILIVAAILLAFFSLTASVLAAQCIGERLDNTQVIDPQETPEEPEPLPV